MKWCNLFKKAQYSFKFQSHENLQPLLGICLVVLLTQIPGLPQDNNDEIRSDGLRKVASGSYELDLDIKIDEHILGVDIEAAIDNAMRSTEMVLEGLHTVDFDFSDLNLDFDPVKIDLHELDIDIEPVELDMDGLDININFKKDDFRFDDGADLNTTYDVTNGQPNELKPRNKENAGTLNKNQKSKGLKKIE